MMVGFSVAVTDLAGQTVTRFFLLSMTSLGVKYPDSILQSIVHVCRPVVYDPSVFYRTEELNKLLLTPGAPA